MALVLITLIGFLTANFIGRAIVSFGEHLLGRMPLVRGIYKALKQIFETVLSNKSDMFRTVGLVEYPRKGVWSLVFVASEKQTEINEKLDQEGDPLIAVFMPCTPNPTTGFLMYVPQIRDRAARHDHRGRRQADRLGRAGGAGDQGARSCRRTMSLLEGPFGNPPAGTLPQPARSSRTASSRPNR